MARTHHVRAGRKNFGPRPGKTARRIPPNLAKSIERPAVADRARAANHALDHLAPRDISVFHARRKLRRSASSTEGLSGTPNRASSSRRRRRGARTDGEARSAAWILHGPWQRISSSHDDRRLLARRAGSRPLPRSSRPGSSTPQLARCCHSRRHAERMRCSPGSPTGEERSFWPSRPEAGTFPEPPPGTGIAVFQEPRRGRRVGGTAGQKQEGTR
jgi:hypothetical protein